MPGLERVAILMSHASRAMGGATRDMILARAMRARGIDARMFRMHPGPQTEREMLLDGSVPGVFCTADNPDDIPHRQTSATLRAEMAAFAPDAVLYKGLGYAVNADVQAVLPASTRIGLVIGGGVKDPLVPRAALVLGEYNEQMQQHFPELFKAKRGLVLPKYIDLEAIGPGRPVPKAEALHDIVNVGAFDKRKNQAALLPFTDRHRVLCIGAGPLLPPIKREHAGNPRLTLPGRLPHPQVFALLRQARIMVHPSTMDGLPRATVEGMACGLPVIALHETVTGGIPPAAGLLVSEAGLQHAVELLLADDALRLRMGRAARRHVQRNHGTKAIEACADEVIRLLSEA